MGQRSLWRRELDHPQHESRHRREGVDGDRRRGIQQWRKTHEIGFRQIFSARL
jgi:hypothetical protein